MEEEQQNQAEQFLNLAALKEKELVPSQNLEQKENVIKQLYRISIPYINLLFKDFKKTPEIITDIQSITKFFEFIDYCVIENPQIFVECVAPPTINEQELVKRNCQSNCSQDFSLWVISRLLIILSHPQCHLVHQSCLGSLCSVFNLVKHKNPLIFSDLLKQLILSLKDLIDISNTLCEQQQGGELGYFSVSGKIDFQDGSQWLEMFVSPIALPNLECCELLQNHIMIILINFMPEVALYASQSLLLLWDVTCRQLELGEAVLKKTCLDAMMKLYELKGLPLSASQDHMISCFCALLESLSSDSLDQNANDLISLELSLGSFLTLLLDNNDQQSLYWMQLVQLSSALSHLVCDHGLLHLRTLNLKQSVCTSLYKLKQILNQDISDCLATIISDLGCFDEQQFVVRILCDSIMEELLTAHGTLNKITMNPSKSDRVISEEIKATEMVTLNDHSSSSDDEMPEKKKKLSRSQWLKTTVEKFRDNEPISSSSKKNILNSSALQRSIFVKLETLLQELLTRENFVTSAEIEGLRVCLEVILLTALRLFMDNSLTSVISSTIDQQNYMITTEFAQRILKACYLMLGVCDKLSTYKSVCYLMGTLIYMTIVGFLETDDEILYTIVWILSLSWLAIDTNWFDLKIDDTKALLKLSLKWIKISDVETKSQCLMLLALLPNRIACHWRVQIIKIILAGSDDDLIIATIERFPLLLHQLGLTYHHLVYDFLHNLLKVKSNRIKQKLAESVGLLSCVISRKTVLIRSNLNNSSFSYKSLGLGCIHCDSLSDVDCSSKNRPKIVDPAMFLPFLQLLQTPDDNVKLGLIGSLRQLVGHVGIRTNCPSTIFLLNSYLELLEEPSYDIRLSFSRVVHYIIGDQHNEDVNKVIVNKLKKVFLKAQATNNICLQETMVLTIGQLSRVAVEDLLLVMIVSLLENLMAKDPRVAASAFMQLQELGQSKHVKMQDIFIQYKQPICKFLVDALHVQGSESNERLPHILQALAHVFDYENGRSLLYQILKLILPHLVSKGTLESSALLKTIAKQIKKGRRELLIDNFKYIFSYLVRNCNKADLEKALMYVQSETEIEIGPLLRSDFQCIHNELLLHISTHYQQVFNGLSMLADKDENYKGARNITKSEDMADFLQPRLLGVLASFDHKILHNNVPLEEKKLVLESLICLMKLMGPKHITSIRMKIMTTLRYALRFTDKGFPELSCRGWDMFVHSVDLAALGPMLSQLVVNLLPLLDKHPAEVAKILHFLIVDNKKLLSTHFHELYFVPEIPELGDVNLLLKEHSEKPSCQANFCQLLTYSLKGVSHESPDVRLQALPKLKQLLHNNQEALHQLIIGNESIDPIITQLISMIMNGCRDSDEKVRNLFAHCLGELGAIDPGRLDLHLMVHKDNRYSNFDVSLPGFAFDLIKELVRSFSAAIDTRSQDCSSYALQELLQLYECQEAPNSNTPGGKLWNSFPEDMKEILFPFLNSRYIQNSRSLKILIKPIYGSSKGSTFRDWICTWTGYLVHKIRSPFASRVFSACSMIIKHDINIAIYLLPHVLLYCLLDANNEEKDEIKQEILSILNEHLELRRVSNADLQHMSTQTIFSVLDHFNRWIQYRMQIVLAQTASTRSSHKGPPDYESDSGYICVKIFLRDIPQNLLAKASFQCQAYSRALMHLETFIKEEKESIHSHLGLLQKIYIALDESDSVSGVLALRDGEPTLIEQILAHESTGQLQDASTCYERAIQLDPDISHHQGLLRCHLGLDQPNTALIYVNGLLNDRPEWTNALNAYRIEAAWKLGSWDSLDHFLKNECTTNIWGIGLGKILMAIKKEDDIQFYKELEIVRAQQMAPLSAASMEEGSYQRGYNHIVRMHMLSELEKGAKTLLNFPFGNVHCSGTETISVSRLLKEWEGRFEVTQSSFRSLEPILNLRRVILSLAEEKIESSLLNKEIGKCWLLSSRIARKGGHLQTAYSYLLNASSYNFSDVSLEKAKWLWTKDQQEQAILTLEKSIAKYYPDSFNLKTDPTEAGQSERLACAQAKLLLGRYSEESANLESTAILKMYKDVVDIHMEWEDGHFYLAQYYDKILATVDKIDKKTELITAIIKHFGISLSYGSHFIYQSMPRLLTMWLDFGAQVVEQHKIKKTSSSLQSLDYYLTAINKNIASLLERLPPYQFLIALPQLISRICHLHPDVFQQLQEIIAKMLVVFPQQAMWLMIAVSKSSFPMRVKRCLEIFSRAKFLKPDLNKFIQDCTKFADRLIDLSNKPPDAGVTSFNLNTHFKSLKRLLEDHTFSPILIPLQTALSATLPSTLHQDHEPFPRKQAFITGFEDNVEILASLQKPKKITIRGSDGHLYHMMCKPKDDLRKDARLMEFNDLVNKYLKREAEARRRHLHIRTYAVVPLNEECGLIEWVQNMNGLRNILNKIYKEKGLYVTGQKLKTYIVNLNAPIEEKLRVFQNDLLPKFPPVFNEWFLRTFPDPTAWYLARLSYARTIAVMSMVGYVLGLGDRHGENILFDSISGDVLHVDFNCLFNKGETFDWPERVPFRLTHNMVDALGPMAYEGVYRKACEVTLRVMRDQKDALMSVLKTFIYDPLVEWSKPARVARSHNPVETGEITNEKALIHVRDIEQRLQGIIKNKTKLHGLPLSIEGHANYLIQEATDMKNLCQMYIGWAAYM